MFKSNPEPAAWACRGPRLWGGERRKRSLFLSRVVVETRAQAASPRPAHGARRAAAEPLQEGTRSGRTVVPFPGGSGLDAGPDPALLGKDCAAARRAKPSASAPTCAGRPSGLRRRRPAAPRLGRFSSTVRLGRGCPAPTLGRQEGPRPAESARKGGLQSEGSDRAERAGRRAQEKRRQRGTRGAEGSEEPQRGRGRWLRRRPQRERGRAGGGGRDPRRGRASLQPRSRRALDSQRSRRECSAPVLLSWSQ